MATTTQDELSRLEPILKGFSQSVHSVVTRLDAAGTTVWQIADGLLRAHERDYGAGKVPPLAERSGESRPIAHWLELVHGLFDLQAVAVSKSQVIDGRLTLLGLARLDARLDRMLRDTEVRWRLEDDLGYPLADVFLPWGLPSRPTKWLELWTLDHSRSVSACAFSPDGGLLATAGEDGTARLWEVAAGTERATFSGHTGRIEACAFSPDGRLLATAGHDQTARLWDVAAGTERATLSGNTSRIATCAFSPDGRLLATAGEDWMARLWDVAAGTERATLSGHTSRILACAFSPDGRLLATAGEDGTARLWDVAAGTERATLSGHQSLVAACAFSPDGGLLATAGQDATARLWDVAAGSERATLSGHTSWVGVCKFAPDRGSRLLATAGGDGTARLWEEVEPPGDLPAVASDVDRGTDLIGVGADADALADLIAASGTMPPLSIGLFGDWGSGKSFLIGQVQERVRRLALRSRRAESSAYCGFVRNIEFNAWHYADANLWASLVTHIFGELTKPEPAAAVTDEKIARAQFARLEEELAARSALAERLERARDHARTAEARRRLLRWTWGLTGVTDNRSLGELQGDVTSIRGASRVLVPNARARLGLLLAALLLGVAVGGAVALLGADWAAQLLVAVVASIAVPLAAIRLVGQHVSVLLERAGETARAVDVKDTANEAEVEVAVAAERDLRQELADLSSGRRIARLAAERSTNGDYRAHLGLVSRIRDDFDHMSEILREEAGRTEREGGCTESTASRELPRIDRIVLYIDDLDRCPPQRVVEVLEAVHLILAVPLFVVVLAVDPRWLLQSLRLHYSELLAKGIAGDNRADEAETAWQSTSVHYLEKIIQVPFALRPMGESSVDSLVRGLLPLPPSSASELGPPGLTEAAVSTSDTDTASASADRPAGLPSAAAQAVTPPTVPSLSPRPLALTKREQDIAVNVAAHLSTPRTVKKFTNLYRLLRVSLDEHSGQLDRFLRDDTDDVPEYQAVLILLATIIAFPEEASDFLLALGDLMPGSPPEDRSWMQHVQRDSPRPWSQQLRYFLDAVSPTANDASCWTCEPFRRWALEVSRYSFATGQQVFAQFRGPHGTAWVAHAGTAERIPRTSP